LWRFVRIGFYSRKIPPYTVQRYRCDTCRRNFGDQTFRVTYWLHRPDLLVPVFWRLNACSGFRQIAREAKSSPSTIATLSGRIGRHALLFHELHRPKGPLTEPLALDSFESFEYSQYYPTSWHVAVGQKSHFFYGFTESECRRRGTMTTKQKVRRAELEARLGRPDPKSIEKEVAALLGVVAQGSTEIELHTDQHQGYPRAIRRMKWLKVDHRTISSRAARTARNPLFAINLLDFLIRHNGANAKRETAAFAKRRASAALRLAHLEIWRNYVQPFSERKRGPTPAMKLGILKRRLEPEAILKDRLFVTRSTLPERWREYYWATIKTRAIPNGVAHVRRYAA